MTERLRYRLQVASGGQNSLWADEPTDLKKQREKCREVDSPEATEEKPAHNQSVRCPAPPIKEPADCGRGRTVHDSRPLYRGENCVGLSRFPHPLQQTVLQV